MKSMRQMINLMEGVQAIPGLSADMQNQESHQQVVDKASAVVAELMDKGNSLHSAIDIAYEMHNSESWALALDQVMHDFNKQAGPVDEDSSYDADFIRSSVADNYGLAATEQELMAMVGGETGYANHPEFQQLFASALADFLNRNDDDNDDEVSQYDYTDASMRAGEMGMEESFNNGYNSTHVADGEDYFPNGSDGPVVKAVGPSGARHGDNPEQKKMQVAETHKELVYAYRSFLKESTAPKKK